MSASAKEKEPGPRYLKPADEKYVENVSIEEWDCPQPGEKKYLPKRIRKNIRANARRVNEEAKQAPVESLNAD